MSFPTFRGYYWMRRRADEHLTAWRIVKVTSICGNGKCTLLAKDTEGLSYYAGQDAGLEFSERIEPPKV